VVENRKTMNVRSQFRRSLASLLLAGGFLCSPVAHSEEGDAGVLAKHAALLEELTKELAAASKGGNDAPLASTSAAGAPTTGLRTGGLTTGTLQPSALASSSSVITLGIGLTPAEQWRALFPQKKQ
jgi:hypothetical protein